MLSPCAEPYTLKPLQATDASGAGGGAVLYQLNKVTASGNAYRKNAATSFGGGLYVLGLESTNARVTDSR